MHEFLAANLAFESPVVPVRILDRDLNPFWIDSACKHVRRRGYTLHLLTAHIKERAGHPERLADLTWTAVRDTILSRPVTHPCADEIEAHIRSLVGAPLSRHAHHAHTR